MNKKIIILVVVLLVVALASGIYLGANHNSIFGNSPSAINSSDDGEQISQQIDEDADIDNMEMYSGDIDDDEPYENDRPNVLSLPEQELSDTIVSALEYGLTNMFLSSSHFLFHYMHAGFPRSMLEREVELQLDNGDIRTETQVYASIPIYDRILETEHLNTGKGLQAYADVMDAFSRSRHDLDFAAMYKEYRWIVKKVLTQELYDRECAPIVNQLLIAYSDMKDDESKYANVSTMMNNHWESTLRNENQELEYYYSELKTFVSKETISKLEDNFTPSRTVYADRALVVWAYSFWNRRQSEGKTEQVYQALSAVRNDYADK